MATAQNHSDTDHTVDRAKFVILEHDYPFRHWDLRMQDGDVLKSWRLLEPLAAGHWISAEQIPDHRSHYLEYEGPISGDRGTVVRLQSGHFSVRGENDLGEQVYDLFGCELATQATLRQDKPGNPQWCFE